MTNKRIRTGQGRVEFFAHKEHILDMLSKGYTLRMIHESLTEEGKITLSYSTLNGFLNPRTKKKEVKKITQQITNGFENKHVPVQQETPSKKPIILTKETQDNTGFVQTVNDEDKF